MLTRILIVRWWISTAGGARILSRTAVVAVMAVVFSAVPVQAHKDISGTYTCVGMMVAGHARHCNAPSIDVNSDGSYDMVTAHGTYRVIGGRWLILSKSKGSGRARIEGKKLIFEFVSDGKKSKITYLRRFERPPSWMAS